MCPLPTQPIGQIQSRLERVLAEAVMRMREGSSRLPHLQPGLNDKWIAEGSFGRRKQDGIPGREWLAAGDLCYRRKDAD